MNDKTAEQLKIEAVAECMRERILAGKSKDEAESWIYSRASDMQIQTHQIKTGIDLYLSSIVL